MKTILAVLVAFSSLYLAGCSNSAVTAPNGSIGGTGTGNTVQFTMQGSGDNQTYNFQFKPAVDVKLNYLIAGVSSLQFSDSVPNPNPGFVFTSTQSHGWHSYTGVQSGQQWTFKFNGSVSSNNQAFTSTVNFTIP